MPTNSDTKVKTNEVRLSYVHLLDPRTSEDGGAPKYEVTILVPKTDKATVKALKAAQAAAFEAGKAGKFGGKPPRGNEDAFGCPGGTVKDGDVDADLEQNPENAGHFYFSARATNRPGIVDRRLNALTDPDEVYSGMYARVSLGAFAFNFNGKKGVTFGLNNVQKLRDGEMLGGRSRAEDDFDELDEDDADDDLV